MMRRNLQQLAGLVWIVASAAGCKHHPEAFATTAIYDAPKSGIRVIAYAKGAVQPNEDLANDASAVAVLCPAAKKGHPLRLDVPPTNVAPRNVSVSGIAGTAPMPWTTGYREVTLASILVAAGYPPPDPAELAEIAESIDAVAFGPKGTKIAGQTHTLVVASVDFEATSAPTIASCSP